MAKSKTSKKIPKELKTTTVPYDICCRRTLIKDKHYLQDGTLNSFDVLFHSFHRNRIADRMIRNSRKYRHDNLLKVTSAITADEHRLVATDLVTTLLQWSDVSGNDIVDPGSGHMSKPLKFFIRDVLIASAYLESQNMYGVTIEMGTIFISNTQDRAFLLSFPYKKKSSVPTIPYTHQISAAVGDIFKHRKEPITLEVAHLCHILSKSSLVDDDVINHCSLMLASERLHYISLLFYSFVEPDKAIRNSSKISCGPLNLSIQKCPSNGAPMVPTRVNSNSLVGDQLENPPDLPKGLKTNIHIWNANYCLYNNLRFRRTCHFDWMTEAAPVFPFGHLFSYRDYRSDISSFLTFCFIAIKHYNSLWKIPDDIFDSYLSVFFPDFLMHFHGIDKSIAKKVIRRRRI